MSVKFKSLKMDCEWMRGCGPSVFCQDVEMVVELEKKEYLVYAERSTDQEFIVHLKKNVDKENYDEPVVEYETRDEALEDETFSKYFEYISDFMDDREAAEYDE